MDGGAGVEGAAGAGAPGVGAPGDGADGRDEVWRKVLAVADAAGGHRAEGFVMSLQRRRAAARQLMEHYTEIKESGDGAASWTARLGFMLALVESPAAGPFSETEVEAEVTAWRKSKAPRRAQDLRARLEAPYERFVQVISGMSGGVSWNIDFRADVRTVLGSVASAARSRTPTHVPLPVLETLCEAQVDRLRALDKNLRDLFATQQSMYTSRLTLGKSRLLDFLRAKEAVHPIRDYADLARRISGHGRECYGLFHPSMQYAPLAFVEICLCNEVARSVEDILTGSLHYGRSKGAAPTVAVFYSVTNTSEGLKGLQLASYMLFGAIRRIRERWPTCNTFVTLSPVPQFRRWVVSRLRGRDMHLFSRSEREHLSTVPSLLSKLRIVTDAGKSEVVDTAHVERFGENDLHVAMEELLCRREWHKDESTMALVQPVLMRWAGRYLMFERQGLKARDPVANFHITNGAIIERINFAGSMSARGLRQSFGIMVNYRYSIGDVQSVSAQYSQRSIVAASTAALLLHALGEEPLFEGIEASQLAKVSLPTYASVYKSGEWIYRTTDGKESEGLYFISQGLVQLLAEGKEMSHITPTVVTTLRAGRVLVNSGSKLLQGASVSKLLSARATSDCHIFFVPMEPWTKAMADFPSERQIVADSAYHMMKLAFDEAGLKIPSRL